jgi:hypothetical protein
VAAVGALRRARTALKSAPRPLASLSGLGAERKSAGGSAPEGAPTTHHLHPPSHGVCSERGGARPALGCDARRALRRRALSRCGLVAHMKREEGAATKTTRNAQRATHNAQRATRNAQRATRNAQRTAHSGCGTDIRTRAPTKGNGSTD